MINTTISKYRYLLVILPILSFLTIFVLRLIWRGTGYDLFFWLSNILLSIYLVVPGVILFIKPAAAYAWYRSFKRTSDKPKRWQQAGSIEKATYYLMAVLEIAAGTVIIFLTIQQIMRS